MLQLTNLGYQLKRPGQGMKYILLIHCPKESHNPLYTSEAFDIVIGYLPQPDMALLLKPITTYVNKHGEINLVIN